MTMNASLTIDATVTSKVYGHACTIVEISVSSNEVDFSCHTPEAMKALEVVLRDAANKLEARIAAAEDDTPDDDDDKPTCEDCQGTGISAFGPPDHGHCNTCGGRGYHIFKEDDDDDSAVDRARDNQIEEENHHE